MSSPHGRGGCRSDAEAGLREPGRFLDQATRVRKEEQFQADLSDVRLHTGPSAAKGAAAVQPRAFTVDTGAGSPCGTPQSQGLVGGQPSRVHGRSRAVSSGGGDPGRQEPARRPRSVA
ncbi:eCIS core domain-containing protein [Streptomyces sp. HF10]|uniref:eCIS core domain-containing protein n=1 Tax=Streptomyces sp. HF10 TaxID=2692233 RepID=UPI001319326A|nr:DUF4157 domain-containing protein [Streptomyces sp. HF10]